jgi:hypothetical protein
MEGAEQQVHIVGMGGPVNVADFHHQPETILILTEGLQGLAG